jgi:hypothetical protein
MQATYEIRTVNRRELETLWKDKTVFLSRILDCKNGKFSAFTVKVSKAEIIRTLNLASRKYSFQVSIFEDFIGILEISII